MSHRLSDNDRTLLSAFMDGELNADEIRDAEHLLGSSEEARIYLGQLRAVRSVSVQAFPVVPIGAATGAGAAAAAGKLTASAISAAAKKSLLIKGLTFGPWSIFGVVAAAASVAIGVGVAMNTGGTAKQQSHLSRPGSSVQAAALASPVSVDTNDLIVPPMTPAEVVRFAVNGTLPIDSKRKQFLTLASHGQDSMVVALHQKPPVDFAVDLDNIAPNQWHELDSVHRALRTALLQYKGGNIAISCDIPSLRLKTLEHLTRIGAQFPQKLQDELSDARRRMEAIQAEAHRTTAQAVRNARIPYVVLSMSDLDQDGATESIRIPIPNQMTSVQSARFMVVDAASIGELQALTPPTPPIPPASPTGALVRRIEIRQRSTTVINPTGERPSTQTIVQQADTVMHPEFDNFFMGNSGASFRFDDGSQQIWFDDSLVEKVQKALQIADSTMKNFDIRMQKSLDNHTKVLIRMQKNNGGDDNVDDPETDDENK